MFFFLEGLQLQNEFFMKHSYLLTPKITFNVDNSLWFLHAVQDLGDSLYVRRNCLCLITASTKLMQYLHVKSFFCSWVFKTNINHRYSNFLCFNFPASKCSSFAFVFYHFQPEKVVLLRKCETELIQFFKAWFSRCKIV